MKTTTSIYIFTYLVTTNILADSIGEKCKTPDGVEGECILLENCNPLINLIKEKSIYDPSVTNTIKKHHCEFIYDPIVCCEIERCKCVPYERCANPDLNGRSLKSCSERSEVCCSMKDIIEPCKCVPNEQCFNSDLHNQSLSACPETSEICCSMKDIIEPCECVPNEECLNPDLHNQSLQSCPETNHICCPKEYRIHCGESSSPQRILNGTVTSIYDFPWMALLEYYKDGVVTLGCGGTLISRSYVLTAAHCIPEVGRETHGVLTKVRLGEHTISKEKDCELSNGAVEQCSDPIVRIDVEKIISHPDYKRQGKQHDIALIKLKNAVTYTDFIVPICLPDFKIDLKNKPLTVVGWGQTEIKDQSDVKLQVVLPLYDQKECKEIYRTKFKKPIPISNSQFCAGGEKDRDSCYGDSGGPIMVTAVKNLRALWFQVGIVSLGSSVCGAKDFPAIYTNLMEYTEWINKNIS